MYDLFQIPKKPKISEIELIIANAFKDIDELTAIYTQRYRQELQVMKKDLRIESGEFLHGPEMEKSDWLKASLVTRKLLDNFSAKEEILQQGKVALRQFLSHEEMNFFEQHLRLKGRIQIESGSRLILSHTCLVKQKLGVINELKDEEKHH